MKTGKECKINKDDVGYYVTIVQANSNMWNSVFRGTYDECVIIAEAFEKVGFMLVLGNEAC